MPRNNTVTIPANVWTEVTVNDITTFAFQVLRGGCHIKGTVGAVAPLNFDGSFYLSEADDPVILRDTLANLFGGGGVVTRLFVHSSEGATVVINHG